MVNDTNCWLALYLKQNKMSWWEMSWFPHNVVYWHCQYPRFQRWQKHSCYHDLIILTISEIFRGKVRPVLFSTEFGSRTFCQLAGKRVYISRIGLVHLFTHSKGRLFHLVSAETSWLCSCMQTNNNRTLDINNRQRAQFKYSRRCVLAGAGWEGVTLKVTSWFHDSVLVLTFLSAWGCVLLLPITRIERCHYSDSK